MARHPQIKNLSEVDPVSTSQGKSYASTRKRLAANCNGKQLGASWFSIPPGKKSFPMHAHQNNEEALFVLSGEGTCRLGAASFPIAAGDYIAMPTGEASAHQIINSGAEPLTYLAVPTAHSTDIVTYTDSNQVAVVGGADMHKGLKSAELMLIFKRDSTVDYFSHDSEEG